MDIYPLYLIKAILAGDIDKMENLGIYEVIEEDSALCEFVDPSKNEIQAIVRGSTMIKELNQPGWNERTEKIFRPDKTRFRTGGCFGRLHSTFDAFETFLFVPDKTTHSGSHIRDDGPQTDDDHCRLGPDALSFCSMYNGIAWHFRAIGVKLMPH